MIHITYPRRLCLECKLKGKTVYVTWSYFTNVYWCGHHKGYVREEHTELKKEEGVKEYAGLRIHPQ